MEREHPGIHYAGLQNEIVVDVAAAPILPYSNEVFSGERQYLLELPIVPGAGRPDATYLTPGD